MKKIRYFLANLTLAGFLVFPGFVQGQEPAGIVTALKGSARLTRTGTQSPLKFRDNLILRDIIDTQESSLVRVLFGGKSTVTVRELSRLEVTEELIPGGGVRSVHNLSSGSVLVNVARRLMKKGDEVVIRTPNAVGAVRGTIIFAQYNPATAQSTFTLLTGKAIVTPQGQPSITLTPDTAVTVSGDASAGIQTGPVTTITKSDSNEILQDSDTGVTVTEEANQQETADAQTEEATQLAEAVVEMTTGETGTTSSETEQAKEETKEEAEAESSEQNSESTETASTESNSEGIETGTSESTTSETETVTAETSTEGTTASSTESASTSTTTETAAVTEPTTTTTSDPVVETTTTPTTTESTVTETPITAGGSGETVTEGVAEVTQVTLNGETKNLAGESLYTFDGASNHSVNPLIEVINSNVVQSSGTSLVLVNSGADATVSGTLLDSDPSTITAAGDIFRVESGANLTLSGALFHDVDGTITAGMDLLLNKGGTVTGTGTVPFIDFNNSDVTINNVLITQDGGTMNVAGPLLKATNGSLSFVNALHLFNGASLSANGPLLDLTNLTLNLGAQPLIDMQGLSTLKNTSGPVIRLSGGSLSGKALFRSDNSGNIFDFTGSLLDLTNATVTLSAIDEDGGGSPDPDNFTLTLQNNEPIFKLDNSTLHLTGVSPQEDIVNIDTEDLVGSIFSGTALMAKNNSTLINDGGGLLGMEGIFNTTATDPLVTINGSSVSTRLRSMFSVHQESVGTTDITLAGPLASIFGGTLTSETNLFNIWGGAMLTSNTTVPFLDFNNVTVNIGPSLGNLFEANDGHLTLAGPLMRANNSNVHVSDSLFNVFSGSQVNSTANSPLITLIDTPVNPLSAGYNHLLFLEGIGSTVRTADTFLKAQNSSLTFNNDAVRILNDAQYQIMSTNPLVLLEGGSHTFNASMMNLSGVMVDPIDNIGSHQPVKGLGNPGFVTPLGAEAFNPIGLLFKATNGANVNVGGTAVRLDTALYEATLPVVELIGTSGGSVPDTILTSNNTFSEVIRSRVVLDRPFASLDRGLINVTNGPFLYVSDGSKMSVADSLLKLANGSRINVVNGPLVEVTGTGSRLDVGGALVEFAGSGGNKIIVRNNLCSPSCTLLKGVPILTGTGGVVNIPGSNPVINPSLGIIDTQSTDALIKAVNSGVVNIAAP